ncbi:MAG: hypothetical protein H6613_20575 [Ignavibacteriales bacterium]|nr:hypothetical protein [Ignavibacteriales bacterium]
MDGNSLLNAFFSLENPILFAALFTVLLVIVLLLIKNRILLPIEKETLELKLKIAELMALFTEKNPNPIIRFDYEGKIISMNEAAKTIFKNTPLLNSSIDLIIPNLVKENKLFSDSEFEMEMEKEIDNKFYFLVIKNLPSLRFVHVYFNDITARVFHENELIESKKTLQKLKKIVDSNTEIENTKISSFLHDSVGNQLTVLIYYLNNLKSTYSNNSKILKVFDYTTDKLISLSKDIRNISHDLSPVMLTKYGLSNELTNLIMKINENGKMQGTLICDESEIIIPNELQKLNIYRICQEAINNIIKHSKCSSFSIQLTNDNNALRILISDNGIGFAVTNNLAKDKSSFGLLNLREKVETYNGTVKIISTTSGTKIFLEFLLMEESE